MRLFLFGFYLNGMNYKLFNIWHLVVFIIALIEENMAILQSIVKMYITF